MADFIFHTTRQCFIFDVERNLTIFPLMRTIRISLRSASEDGDRSHDLRNVGEEIHCHFLGKGIAEVPDMDSGTTAIHVVVSATRHLGTVTAFVRKAIRRYGLSEFVQVTRVDGSDLPNP